MKKLLVLLLICLASSVLADSRVNLVTKFRQRVQEEDTTLSPFSDSAAQSWANQAQDKIARLGGYIRKSADVIFRTGKFEYNLPADFKYERGVIVRWANGWAGVIKNENLFKDTGTYTYDIWFKNVDSGRLYLSGTLLKNLDTVRVFYFAKPTPMTLGSDECSLSSDDETLVIDEMIAMYLEYKTAYQVMQAVQQQTRQDMGLPKPLEKQ